MRLVLPLAALAGIALLFVLFRSSSPSPPQPIADPELIGNCGSCDLDLTLSPAEIPVFERRARAGDLRAANALGNHYRATHQSRRAREWYALVANRGDCETMDRLASRDPDEPPVPWSELNHWREQYRAHRCTVQGLLDSSVIENSPVIE